MKHIRPNLCARCLAELPDPVLAGAREGVSGETVRRVAGALALDGDPLTPAGSARLRAVARALEKGWL